MRKLKILLLRASLQRHTDLVSRLRNDKRWSATCAVLKRHIELRPHVRAMENDDVEGLLPTVSMERRLDTLSKKLKELDEMTKRFQCADTTIWGAQAY